MATHTQLFATPRGRLRRHKPRLTTYVQRTYSSRASSNPQIGNQSLQPNVAAQARRLLALSLLVPSPPLADRGVEGRSLGWLLAPPTAATPQHKVTHNHLHHPCAGEIDVARSAVCGYNIGVGCAEGRPWPVGPGEESPSTTEPRWWVTPTGWYHGPPACGPQPRRLWYRSGIVPQKTDRPPKPRPRRARVKRCGKSAPRWP